MHITGKCTSCSKTRLEKRPRLYSLRCNHPNLWSCKLYVLIKKIYIPKSFDKYKKEVLIIQYFFKLVRHRGFEPRTTWLKVKCSTNWANIPYIYLNLSLYNAQSRNRTSDTGIFSPLLYQLSYLGLKLMFKNCGSRIWTYDLRVMSPTSYQTAPSRDIN